MSSSLHCVLVCLGAVIAVCSALPPQIRHSRHIGHLFPQKKVADAVGNTVCQFQVEYKIVQGQEIKEIVCAPHQKVNSKSCCNNLYYHCVQLTDMIKVKDTEVLVHVGCACMKRNAGTSKSPPHPDNS